jgi:hypothetical protein
MTPGSVNYLRGPCTKDTDRIVTMTGMTATVNLFVQIVSRGTSPTLLPSVVIQIQDGISVGAPTVLRPPSLVTSASIPYSLDTSRPKNLAFNQSTITRTRFRATSWSASCQQKTKCELTAKAHAQVSALPEQICHSTTTGKISTEPAHIGNSFIGTNIC